MISPNLSRSSHNFEAVKVENQNLQHLALLFNLEDALCLTKSVEFPDSNNV